VKSLYDYQGSFLEERWGVYGMGCKNIFAIRLFSTSPSKITILSII